jgi:hypothetical protein
MTKVTRNPRPNLGETSILLYYYYRVTLLHYIWLWKVKKMKLQRYYYWIKLTLMLWMVMEGKVLGRNRKPCLFDGV